MQMVMVLASGMQEPWPGCPASPGSHTLGEGLRPSTERLSCEDEGVPLFIRGVWAPVLPSVLAR